MSPESREVAGINEQARRFNRRLKISIVLVIVITFSMVISYRIVDLLGRRDQLRFNNEQRAANIALILSAHIERAFSSAAAVVQQLVDEAPQIGGANGSSREWGLLLRSADAGLEGIESLSVTDRDGIVRRSTAPELVGHHISDNAPARSLHVPLTRSLPGKDGSSDGVVEAIFSLDKLNDLFRTVDVGDNGSIVVFDSTGRVVFPAGTAASFSLLFDVAQHAGESGTFRGPVVTDGPMLLSAFHAVDRPHLIVAVSLSDAEILASIHRERDTSIAAGLTMSLIIGAVVFLLFRAIDQRTAAEQSLSRVMRMESIGRFTGGVAHDFNNMLTVILGNIAMMREEGAKGHSLDRIEAAARHSSELTHRLLTFASRRPLTPETLDLNQTVQSLQPMLKSLSGETVKVELDLHPKPCVANLDRVQTESAVMNLCINARDAMPKGGTLTIQTGTVELDETVERDIVVRPGFYVYVTARDTGVGIPPENLPRIFEPFFTTKEVGKASGLGLSTVYGFVKQSGGAVKVESEVGKGTGVTIYFPETTDPLPVRSEKEVALKAPQKVQKILVVEDEDGIRELAEVGLRQQGYSVLAASDGPTALEIAAREGHIDLLLTDIILPNGMNGYEVAEELEKIYPNLRVLFASGYAEQFVQTQQRKKSGSTILMKPYGRGELVEAVRAAISVD